MKGTAASSVEPLVRVAQTNAHRPRESKTPSKPAGPRIFLQLRLEPRPVHFNWHERHRRSGKLKSIPQKKRMLHNTVDTHAPPHMTDTTHGEMV